MAYEYPYPVLMVGKDDYSSSSFDCDVKATLEGAALVINISFKLDNQGIQDLITEGLASYGVLVTCSKSGFRKYYCDNHQEMGIRISTYKLFDKVTIAPEVIAVENIYQYENELLNDEYKDYTITIPKTGFLAVAPETEIKIERERYKNLESICKFAASDDKLKRNYDDDGDCITIFLPEELFIKYSRLSKDLQEIYTAIHITPVLVDVVQRYWVDKVDADEWRWHDVLDEKFRTMLGDDYRIDNAYDAVIRIIDELLFDASNTIYTSQHGEVNYDDYDDDTGY